MKFLIVEDEPIIAEDIKLSIKSQGHKITDIVSSAKEAFISIDKNQPDAIFMDIGLKGPLNGINTSKIIYENYGIRVIFLRSFFNKVPEDANECRPYSFLIKPIVQEEIIQSIDKVKSSLQCTSRLHSERQYQQERFYSKLLSF